MRTAFERVHNFRDIADTIGTLATGERIAPGRIFRSAVLAQASAADRKVLRDLGVRTVIDLRSQEELDAFGRFSAPDIRTLHMSLLDQQSRDKLAAASSLADCYISFLNGPSLPTALVQVLETLADPQISPVVVSCSAGKDRTGIVIAVLGLLLGAKVDAVVADYAATGANLDGLYRQWAEHPRSSIVADLAAGRPNLLAPPEAMLGLCQTLGAEDLARLIARYGALPDLTARLRHAFLVGPATPTAVP
ncbi:tyrosine-protein phosphatase [Kribbella sp. NPDC056345]|uniref:tyrosine-protein phosphatase n=1 Tax=Kribbella sp. NPDC056345 TaxID=3345789 RepID=UPI0035D9A04D